MIKLANFSAKNCEAYWTTTAVLVEWSTLCLT